MRGSAEIVRKKSLQPIKKSFSSSIVHSKDTLVKSTSNAKIKVSNGNTGEKCGNCHRSFRDSEHLAKHRRGALCRRLVQRVARQNRKMATKFDNKPKSTLSAVASRKKPHQSKPMLAAHKPYQCSVCGARFLDKVNVELHCERHHNANRHLWVEVARGQDAQSIAASPSSALDTNSISSMGDGSTGACTSRAPFNMTPNNNLVDVNNSNHVSSPRSMPLDRFKCTECNAFFHSEVQLHEHKKVSHQSLSNCIESPSSHVLFHQSSPAAVLNRNMSSNANCQQYIGHNVGGIDSSITNLSLNQPIITPSYIFPAPPTYYSHDPNSSMQQNVVHPHVSYMQPQHAVHPHVLHHQGEMQPQEPPPQQQHPDQVHGEQHPHMQHQQPQSHLHSQDLLLSLPQSAPVQPPLPLHNPLLGGHQAHQSAAISSQSYSSPILLESPPSHLTSSTVMVSSELPSLVYSNANNSVPGDRLSTSVLPSSSSSDPISSSLTNVNATTTSVSTMPMLSAFGVVSTASSRASCTTKSPEKQEPATVNTKWNMCGDCGTKFIDLMNLELHVEKKHPLLTILGSVDFKDGTVCYKTGTCASKNQARSVPAPRTVSKDMKAPQRHLCTICNHTGTSLAPMVDHVMSSHNLSGKPMIDAIQSEEESSDCSSMKSSATVSSPKENSSFGDGVQSTGAAKSSKLLSGKDGKSLEPSSPLGEDSCYLCQTNFNSSAELIRHRIKDKRHICSICLYVTCSRKVLTSHLKAEHDLLDITGSSTAVFSDLEKRLSCWRCNGIFQKTSDFINHLKCHGNLSGRCEKCSKQDNNIANILIHMTTIHPDYMNRVAITVTCKGKTSTCLYLQTLAGDLLDASCLESRGRSEQQNSEADKSQNTDLNSRKNLTSADSNDSSPKDHTSPVVDEERKTYACSQCLVSLYGTSSLENHLKQHEDRGSSGVLLGLANIKRSPSEERQSPEIASCTHNSELSKKLSKIHKPTKGIVKNKGKTSDVQKVGLQSLPLTRGFKCEECGLTKDKSDVLVSHIQKVHISGNLIHMVNEKKGAGTVKEYRIYIVTPISST